MSKYAPLHRHLKSLHRSHVPMTFAEIERLLGFSLPASSRKHRAWWSNNPDNNVMTRAWIEAGYATEDVDLEKATVVFHRRGGDIRDDSQSYTTGHPLYGALAGTLQIAPGYDLTAPLDEPWEAAGQ